MEATYSSFDYQKSIERISELLDTSDASYEDHTGIPARDRLTFANGFYVDVTVLFVDMRKSKELSEKHTRPVLAKIYRTYISETVAVLKGNATISEVYIEGDGVWAVFNTTTKAEVVSVFETAAQIASLVDIINIKLQRKGYSKFEVGIGIDDGESLYIKAGHKGSNINEVVWIGRVVGAAAAMCKNANSSWVDGELMASTIVYRSLTDKYKGFLEWNYNRQCYQGNVRNILMNEWVLNNA